MDGFSVLKTADSLAGVSDRVATVTFILPEYTSVFHLLDVEVNKLFKHYMGNLIKNFC